QMNPDGTNVDRLTNNTSSETEPRWSPDGKKISFRSDMDGPGQIFVMNSDGTNITNITQTSFAESYPSWSPDGKKIVFTSLRDGNHEIYIMNADGSKQERLTYNEVIDSIPSWQPIPNREPAVSDDQLTLSFNGSKTIDVLVNDTDEESLDSTHLTIHTLPKNGTASIIDGKVKYVAKSGFAGKDELTYQICDSFLLDQKCATGVLSITVQSGPKPPAPKIEKVGSVE